MIYGVMLYFALTVFVALLAVRKDTRKKGYLRIMAIFVVFLSIPGLIFAFIDGFLMLSIAGLDSAILFGLLMCLMFDKIQSLTKNNIYHKGKYLVFFKPPVVRYTIIFFLSLLQVFLGIYAAFIFLHLFISK